MVRKQSSDAMSSLAAHILNGSKYPTYEDALSLAASVLSQDETKGLRRTLPPVNPYVRQNPFGNNPPSFGNSMPTWPTPRRKF